MRLVGPNCLGVLVPRAKLNASFAASMSPPGDLALISQSGAIAAGLVAGEASPPVVATAGLVATLAGAYFKMSLITRAGFNQGFALPHLPVRGTRT